MARRRVDADADTRGLRRDALRGIDVGSAAASLVLAVDTETGVYALDVEDGEPRWGGEFEFDSDRPWQGEVTEEVTSIPAIADGALFVGSPGGGLYAIGEERLEASVVRTGTDHNRVADVSAVWSLAQGPDRRGETKIEPETTGSIRNRVTEPSVETR